MCAGLCPHKAGSTASALSQLILLSRGAPRKLLEQCTEPRERPGGPAGMSWFRRGRPNSQPNHSLDYSLNLGSLHSR